MSHRNINQKRYKEKINDYKRTIKEINSTLEYYRSLYRSSESMNKRLSDSLNNLENINRNQYEVLNDLRNENALLQTALKHAQENSLPLTTIIGGKENYYGISISIRLYDMDELTAAVHSLNRRLIDGEFEKIVKAFDAELKFYTFRLENEHGEISVSLINKIPK